MKFKVLVPQEIEIPAALAEEIFKSLREDWGGELTEPIHFELILRRANFQHGIALPKGYKFRFDGGERNKITLRQIEAAKRREAKRKEG